LITIKSNWSIKIMIRLKLTSIMRIKALSMGGRASAWDIASSVGVDCQQIEMRASGNSGPQQRLPIY